MSKLKTIIVSVLALLATVILVGCSQAKTTNLQNFQSGNFDNRVTLHYEGDKMTTQEVHNVVFYKSIGVEDADAAKAMLEDILSSYKDLKGFTHTIDFQKDRFVETVKVDYSKIDMDKSLATIGDVKTDDGKAISYTKLLKQFTSIGYKEVKDGKFQELSK